MEEDENKCVTCDYGCGSHTCRECRKPRHAIPPCCIEEWETEEGYGSQVLCKECGTTKSGEKGKMQSSSRKLWNWKAQKQPGKQTESGGTGKKKLKSD